MCRERGPTSRPILRHRIQSPSSINRGAVRGGCATVPRLPTIRYLSLSNATPAAAADPRSLLRRPNKRTQVRTERVPGAAVGDPTAVPRYVIEDYAEDVVIQNHLKIEGWPSWIPFRNASEIRGGSRVLGVLLKLWKEKKIKFVPATELDRLNAALDPTLVAPSGGFLHCKPDGGRNDIGRSRYRWKTKPDGGALRYPKDGPKSDKFVRESDEEGGVGGSKAEARPLRLQPLPLLPPLSRETLKALSRDGRAGRWGGEDPEEISDFSDDGDSESEIETAWGSEYFNRNSEHSRQRTA